MWKVQLFKLNYNDLEPQAVQEVLESAWITMGQKTIDFEAQFEQYLGNDSKCLAVSNGTAALHMALLALGIGACSLINNNIPSGEIWAGVPAKKIRG